MRKEAIDEGFKSLKAEFAKVTKLKELMEKDKAKKEKEKKEKKGDEEEEEEEDDDKALEYVNTFYEHAEKSLNFIDEQIAKIDKDYQDCLKFLAEDKPKDFTLKDHFIPLFSLLNDQIMEALKKYKERKEKKEKAEKKRRKEEEKAAKKAKKMKK